MIFCRQVASPYQSFSAKEVPRNGLPRQRVQERLPRLRLCSGFGESADEISLRELAGFRSLLPGESLQRARHARRVTLRVGVEQMNLRGDQPAVGPVRLGLQLFGKH